MNDDPKPISSPAAMRICVVGAGAVGGFLASLLARAGNDVSVIARGEHLAAIQRNGLTLTSTAGLDEFTVPVHATNSLSKLPPQDAIFVTLKAHDTPGIAKSLAPAIGVRTIIVPVLNGIPWWYFHGMAASPLHAPISCLDPDGEASRHIDMDAVIGCVVRMAAEVAAPGVVRHTFGKRFILGEPSGEMSSRLQGLCGALKAAGLDAVPTPRIRDEIWTKLVGNLSTNPLSALTHGWLDDLCASPELEKLMRQLMAECRAVGTRYGAEFTSDIDGNIERVRALGRSKPSMLQDVEKGRPIEVAAILDSVAELARRAQAQTPTLDVVLPLIRERARHLGSMEKKQ